MTVFIIILSKNNITISKKKKNSMILQTFAEINTGLTGQKMTFLKSASSIPAGVKNIIILSNMVVVVV